MYIIGNRQRDVLNRGKNMTDKAKQFNRAGMGIFPILKELEMRGVEITPEPTEVFKDKKFEGR